MYVNRIMKNSREEQEDGNVMLWSIFGLLKNRSLETQEFIFENKLKVY